MWWVWGFPFYCMFINICAAPWRHCPWHAVPPSRASRAQGGLNIDKVLPCAREDWLRLNDFASLLEFDRISLKILTFLLWIICMATGLLPCIVLILNTDRNQIRLDWNGLERISMKCKSAADYLFAVACIYALQLSLLSGMQWTKFNCLTLQLAYRKATSMSALCPWLKAEQLVPTASLIFWHDINSPRADHAASGWSACKANGSDCQIRKETNGSKEQGQDQAGPWHKQHQVAAQCGYPAKYSHAVLKNLFLPVEVDMSRSNATSITEWPTSGLWPSWHPTKTFFYRSRYTTRKCGSLFCWLSSTSPKPTKGSNTQ